MIARVVAAVAGVLTIALTLIAWFSEPEPVAYGVHSEPAFTLPVTFLLWVLAVTVCAVAAWQRDLVVLGVSLGVVAFLWWVHPATQGYALVSRQEYEAMRGSLLASNGILAGALLMAAGAVSALVCRITTR